MFSFYAESVDNIIIVYIMAISRASKASAQTFSRGHRRRIQLGITLYKYLEFTNKPP